jgi:predicted ATPase/DNA-binding NarL/FixJ family response regulator
MIPGVTSTGDHASAAGNVERAVPTLLNRFVGRTRELAEITRLGQGARLLTLTGPSGVGKTRLVIAFAAQVQGDFADGVAFTEVGMAEAQDRVTEVVASALRVAADQPVRLAEIVGNRHLLLVLDDCSGAPGACADLVLALLSRCPRLQVVATSTERLGVPGEMLWQVPPLATPEPTALFADIAASEAVQLLVERMVEVSPHFALDEHNANLVAEICRLLDGLPLALELAAGWVNALSLSELAEGLDDPLRLLTRGARSAPARHHTLRAALDWSTRQLGSAERRLLARLSVFAGSWDLDAARAVCADEGLPTAHILPTLAELVGRSLVQVARGETEAARYRLLRLVRQYACDELVAAGELRMLRERHARWYRSLVDAIPVGSGSPEQIQALMRDQDNLRAVLDWAVSERDAELSFGVITRLHAVWYIQAQFTESRSWFGRVLALGGGSAQDRAMTANWASNHALCQGDIAGALEMSALAQEAAADSPSAELRALSLDGYATILLDQARLSEAMAAFEQVRSLLDDPRLDWLLASVDYRLADIHLERGQDADADQLCRDALRLPGGSANLWIRARIERTHGRVALWRGDLNLAETRLESALECMRRIGDLQGETYALLDVARLAQERRQLPAARRSVREALLLTSGDSEPLRVIRVLEGAAALLASARPEGCLQIAAAAARERARLGVPAWPLEESFMAHVRATAEGRLSPAAVTTAVASGTLLLLERALLIAHGLLDSLDPPANPSSTLTRDVLTPRELAVAELVGQGKTNRAIARELVISEGTVRAHVEHILSKLELRSRTEIASRLGRNEPPLGG